MIINNSELQNNFETVGTCSICGGKVVRENVFLASLPPQVPRAKCTRCGAYEKKNYGPVIEMEKQ